MGRAVDVVCGGSVSDEVEAVDGEEEEEDGVRLKETHRTSLFTVRNSTRQVVVSDAEGAMIISFSSTGAIFVVLVVLDCNTDDLASISSPCTGRPRRALEEGALESGANCALELPPSAKTPEGVAIAAETLASRPA